MKRPAIFFDRDNTLIVGTEYLGDPNEVVLNEGAAEAVAAARSMGFATVVFSNQSGVARGMFTEDDVRAVNQRMDAMLRTEHPGAIIDRHEFCPHHPDASVQTYREENYRRKPKPGMIIDAAEKMALDISRSWVIGDAPRDVEAGMAVGCKAILIRDPKLAASPAALAELRVQPDRIVSSLTEAMEHIARSTGAPNPYAEAFSSEDETNGPRLSLFALHEASDHDPGDSGVFVAPDSTDSAPDTDSQREKIDQRKPEAARVQQSPPASLQKLVHLGEQILHELRRSHEQHPADFSVSKLLAGVIQIIALAVLFLVYLHRNDASMEPTLLVAIFLQVFTVALLIMSRQR